MYKEKIEKILAELSVGLFEREECLKLVLLSMFAGKSIFLYGPPGTAKSMIARRASLAFDTLGNSRIPSENSRIPSANTPSYGILDELYHTCLERKLSGDESTSYTAKLYKKAPNSYLKKIAEEACEFALAIKDFKAGAKGEHKETQPAYDIVYEGADVLFHMLVALADVGIHPEQLLNELRRREGLSGLIEKANRKG